MSEVRSRLFRHAARYPGRSREKCCAIGVADLILNARQPHAFQMMQLVSTDSVWEKTSQIRQERLRKTGMQIFDAALGVAQEAVLAGDLAETGITPQEVVLGLFTMSKGAMLVQSTEEFVHPTIAGTVLRSLQMNRHRFLDGAGWKPLYKDFDYEALEKRLHGEYFAVP